MNVRIPDDAPPPFQEAETAALYPFPQGRRLMHTIKSNGKNQKARGAADSAATAGFLVLSKVSQQRTLWMNGDKPEQCVGGSGLPPGWDNCRRLSLGS